MIPVMIVPVLKFYDRLQNMFETIDYPIDHAIIIDNGGKLKSLNNKYINKISIINMPNNLGVPTSWNLGIKLEPFAKYWLFSQDDIQWVTGGLEKIDNMSSSDCICIDMDGNRPFSSFTVGDAVINKVGLFDETYFPLIGDDFNYHKRCHYYNITEKNISGTFIAEKSASIRELISTGKLRKDVIDDNFKRSLLGFPCAYAWRLQLRRWQGRAVDTNEINATDSSFLDFDYKIHSEYENKCFKNIPPNFIGDKYLR